MAYFSMRPNNPWQFHIISQESKKPLSTYLGFFAMYFFGHSQSRSINQSIEFVISMLCDGPPITQLNWIIVSNAPIPYKMHVQPHTPPSDERQQPHIIGMGGWQPEDRINATCKHFVRWRYCTSILFALWAILYFNLIDLYSRHIYYATWNALPPPT